MEWEIKEKNKKNKNMKTIVSHSLNLKHFKLYDLITALTLMNRTVRLTKFFTSQNGKPS